MHGLKALRRRLSVWLTQAEGCDGKQPFSSAAEAWLAITDIAKRKQSKRQGFAYRCRFCRAWHITAGRSRKWHRKPTTAASEW